MTQPTLPIPDRYDPAAIEPEIYRRWRDAGAFTANPRHSLRAGGHRVPFTIVMPPPNVTAILHVGHGLNNTIQDVVIRWARMRGTEALWVPGTDHAGIATQNVVEKLVATEGTTRAELGRAAFVRRTEAFVTETGGTILAQLEALGASADWTRTAYTLSPQLSTAVMEAFVQLHERGLIYKGHRVIHWCPRCLTSLSDEEAEFEEEDGALYHIAYPVVGAKEPLIIATTRPETMLADVALAVNPDDDRYLALHGKSVTLPIVGIEIPIVTDAYADPAFGTGVVKITPAHDANDFEVGRRHKLEMPVVIDEHGALIASGDAIDRVPAELRGLDRFEARARIVNMLRASGALVKVEQRRHAVRHCYRCDTVVEPRLSDQWFVKMEPLARPALEAVRDGRLRVLPERWEAVYVNWLENIRDWNISRQLWWGHRIPVWYCDACPAPKNVIVARSAPAACLHCAGPLRQDEDVLDTWFSSWLWPISTLGWPDRESIDLRAFYPTDALVTAPEILFFWVARMVMSGFAFMDKSPFHTVYLHGTARDTNHVKMSKSLGNGIDPLDVIRLYGADALRWTLVAGLGMGADVILDPRDIETSFAPGRNFVTKLWNIGRFILGALGDEPVKPLSAIDPALLTRADKWILERLDVAIAECDAALGALSPADSASASDRWPAEERFSGFRFSEYCETARRFVWNELADWYVEAVKARIGDADADRDTPRAVLAHAFDRALRLLHPVIPFVTEELAGRLPSRPAGALLVSDAWPTTSDGAIDFREAAGEFELVREAVLAIRQLRSSQGLPPGKPLDAYLRIPSTVAGPAQAAAAGRANAMFNSERIIIGKLTRASVTVGQPPEGAAAHAVLSGGIEVVIPLEGLIDTDKECARLKAELGALEGQIAGREQRLGNAKYLERAPASVVESDRATLAEMQAKAHQLREKVKATCGG